MYIFTLTHTYLPKYKPTFVRTCDATSGLHFKSRTHHFSLLPIFLTKRNLQIKFARNFLHFYLCFNIHAHTHACMPTKRKDKGAAKKR